MKDVPETTPQNINPLTVNDLKKILDQSTKQGKLCENIVLVSVKEYQKAMFDIKVQTSIQTTIYISSKKVEIQVEDGQDDQSKEEKGIHLKKRSNKPCKHW